MSECLSIIEHCAYSGRGFEPIDQQSIEGTNYEKGRQLAIKLLGEAADGRGLTARGIQLAGLVRQQLEVASVLVSTNSESEAYCTANKFEAFVHPSAPYVVHICKLVRERVREDDGVVPVLAQLFIHEGVHLTGEYDECLAVLFEEAVMNKTIGIQTRGGRLRYGELCKNQFAANH